MTTADAAPRSPRRRLLTWGLPALAIAGAVVVGAVLFQRQSTDAATASSTAASRSSTVAWSGDSRSLWVTSPDDDQVVELDPSTLDVVQRVAVPGQPRELSVIGDRLVVTGAQATDLRVIDLGAASGPRVSSIALPCGGSRSVITAPAAAAGVRGDLAVVTCPTDDLLAVVDLRERATVGTVAVAGRPTGIVRDGGRVTVSTAGDGRLHMFELADLARATGSSPATVAAVSSRRAWVDGRRIASSLSALDHGPRGPVGVYQVIDNQRRLTRQEIEAGSTYGTPPRRPGPVGTRDRGAVRRPVQLRHR